MDLKISKDAVRWLSGIFVLLVIIGIIVSVVLSLKRPGVKVNLTQCPADIQACADKTKLFVITSQVDDETTGDCYRAGEKPQNVCKEHMAVAVNFNCTIQGICDCDYKDHDRHLIYTAESDSCHEIFTQANCPYGQMLSITQGPRPVPICIPDICKEARENGTEAERHLWVPFNAHRCEKLYQVPVSVVGCTEPLRFYKWYIYPRCTKAPVVDPNIGSIGGIGPSPCPRGSKQAQNGYCQPVIEFDW